MKGLNTYIRPFFFSIALGMVLKMLGTLADIALPLLLSQMVDKGIASSDTKLIISIGLTMLAVAAISFISTLTGHYLAAKTSQRISQSIRDKLYAHLQKLTLEDVGHISAASLTTRATYDPDIIAQFISMTMRMLVRNGLLAAGGIIMAATLDFYLTITLLFMMLVIVAVSMLLYRMTRRLFVKVQQGLDSSSNVVREALSGIKTIKAFDKLSKEQERFTAQSAVVRDNEIAAGTVSAVITPGITLISNIGLIAILVFSAYRVNGGQMELGGLIAIVSYINMVVHAMTVIPRIFARYSRATASASRIAEIFEIVPTVGEIQPGALEMNPQAPAVQFENVSFRYRGNSEYTLKDISFTVERGTTLGIIGETGSGKTTLVGLLAGLYRPQEGRVLVGGMDSRNFGPEALGNEISVAQQQYDIFTATVKSNVILNRSYDKQRMNTALRQAQLIDFVDELEKGADTEIYQAGANLSGGQRQRLNVARVFYSGASILVFDDVASALDSRTNVRLQAELRALQPEKTVITVAQRIGAICHAEKIIVLDKGMVAGTGTHEQLLEECEIYRNIFASQQEVISVEHA